MKVHMKKITKLMAEYKEKESEEEPRFKEAGDRLQVLHNNIASFLRSTNNQEKTRESEENGDSMKFSLGLIT